MLIHRLAVASAALGLAALSSAQLYNFDTLFVGDLPTGGPVYGSMLVEDVAPDTVQFTLTNNLGADSQQFFSRLFLNLDPSVTSLNLVANSGYVTGFTLDPDDENFAGNGFDSQVLLDLAPPSDRLTPGKSATWQFTGVGLDAADFAVKTPQSGLYNLLHIQGIPGGGSAHVTSAPVPEPGLFLAVGSLLLGGRLLKKRRA